MAVHVIDVLSPVALGEFLGSAKQLFATPAARLANMRWFRCFAVPKKKKEDATNGTDHDAADPNQSIRHEHFLSGCVRPAKVP
jgi:hypothetical protein